MTRAERALQQVIAQFPFPGYIDPTNHAFSDLAEITLKYLHKGDRILDFGCGPCDKTAFVQCLGFRCSGYDDLQDDWHQIPGNRERIQDFAEQSGVQFTLAQEERLPFAPETFEMIMLHHVLEHLHNTPRILVNELLTFLKPEGFLFITVPNAANVRKRLAVLVGKTNYPRFDGFYWYPGEWRGHVREYVKDDLVQLANYLGLDMVELRGTDHMLGRLSAKIRPIYLQFTRLFPSLKDSWLLLAQKPGDWTPKKELPPEQLAVILGKSTTYRYN